MMNDKDMLKVKREQYEKLQKQFLILDEDLQELHQEETRYLEDDLVGYICKVNNLEKMIFTQKYRKCKNKCKEGEANIFHCEFCPEVNND